MSSAPVPAGLRRLNAEVLTAERPIALVGDAEIAWLKREVAQTPRRRIRICAHADTADRLHEMLIVQARGVYVRPHKHLGKSESAHVIEGDVDVVFFDEGGKVGEVLRLGAQGSGRRFYYRIDEPLYHTLLIKSEYLVYHEVTNGPFRREDTVFAPWSPAEEDREASETYQRELARAIG